MINNGKWTEWSAIWSEFIRASSNWKRKYDFTPKLHDTKFNYRFITAILKTQNSDNTNLLLIRNS